MRALPAPALPAAAPPSPAPITLALTTALVLAACSSAPRRPPVTENDRASVPPRVAVLPPVGGNLEAELAARVRIEVGAVFEQHGYVRFDDGWVDQRLALSGLQPWNDAWTPPDEFLCFWGKANGIDGLVLLEDFTADDLTTFVYNSTSLLGRCRVLDTKAGHSTWILDLSASESGGLLLQSGQVFDAVASLGASSRLRLEALAASLAIAATADLPQSHDRVPIGPRPVVATVRADPSAAVRGDDRVEVVVEGTPGCRAFASLPQCLGRYPLVEESPGRYAGSLPSKPEARAVVAVLRDRMGASSKPMSVAIGGDR